MHSSSLTAEKLQKPMDTAEKKLLVVEATKKEILRGIFIFWLVSTVFLFLRIFLKALGSDPQSVFAGFIYLVSGIFLLPFYRIFPWSNETIQPGVHAFDAQAVTAIFCYTILVILTLSVTLIVTRMVKTGKQVEETVQKNNPVDPTESEEIIR